MKKRTIYVAGPMSGLPEYNYPAFIEAAAMLAAKYPQAEIINPAENFERATGLPYPTYIRKSFEQVLSATELYVLAGWENSQGASAEVAMASLLDLVIVFENGAKPAPERKVIEPLVEVEPLINALTYAQDAIVKLADHCDMESVQAEGLDVQDCRDCVEIAIERAGGVL